MILYVVDIVIRDVEKFSEYEECVRLQIEVWGFKEVYAVPAMELVAECEYGGLCIGAFDEDKLVGFVCGFTGWDGTRAFHHSHMLAVLPNYRRRGLGEKLKWAQRSRVLDKGLSLVNWTFDPLQAHNAHLNINCLGCIVRKYKINLYGESDSKLHGGLPTDRFEAEWELSCERVTDLKKGKPLDRPRWQQLPRSNRTVYGESGFLTCEEELMLNISESELLVEIPGSITDMMESDPGLALDWRIKTRRLLVNYLDKGYWIIGFHNWKERLFYRLSCTPRLPGPA